MATGLVLTTGLIVATAWAGPGARLGTKGGEGSIRALAADALPFTPQATVPVLTKQAGLERVAPLKVAATREKTAPALKTQLAKPEAQAERYDVLVVTRNDPSALLNQLGNAAVSSTYQQALKGFSAKLTAREIALLQANDEVESIGLDEQVHTTLDGATRWTGVTKLREDFGATGDGDGFEQRYSTADVVIAVIDTGIDVAHRDLAGKVIGWKDMVAGEPEPYDDHGHGTHVAGIAAGAGAVNPSLKGVAPGAALVGVKVLDANGRGPISNVISGIEWVIANKQRYNIKVLKIVPA